MKVEFGDDLYSFSVESASGQAPYVVCLVSNDGIGMCSCADHQFRCSPKIAKGQKAQCKHVSACLKALGQAIVDRRVEQLRQEESKADREPTQYEALANEFKRVYPKCGVCAFGKTIDVHHSRGKLGPLLIDQRFWIPVCRTCHDWIGSNPDAARKLTWNGIPVLCAKGEWNSQPGDECESGYPDSSGNAPGKHFGPD